MTKLIIQGGGGGGGENLDSTNTFSPSSFHTLFSSHFFLLNHHRCLFSTFSPDTPVNLLNFYLTLDVRGKNVEGLGEIKISVHCMDRRICVLGISLVWPPLHFYAGFKTSTSCNHAAIALPASILVLPAYITASLQEKARKNLQYSIFTRFIIIKFLRLGVSSCAVQFICAGLPEVFRRRGAGRGGGGGIEPGTAVQQSGAISTKPRRALNDSKIWSPH